MVWFGFWFEAEEQAFRRVPSRNFTCLRSPVAQQMPRRESSTSSFIVYLLSTAFPSHRTHESPAPGYHGNSDEPAASSAALISPALAETQR